MRTSRRGFLRNAAASVALPVLGSAVLDALERRLEAYGGLSASDAVRQEEFWAEIRRVFPVPADYVNLENGYSSPQPAATYEAFQQHQKLINDGLSFYMRRRLADDYRATKTALAELAGVTPEEIVITRNTTESLGTVIHGLTYAAGDEAVMCDQDYGSMLQQFRQESRRHGLKCVEIPIPLTPRDDQEMVDTYARAITPRTRVVLLTPPDQHHRTDPAGPQDRRDGARARRRRDRRCGAFVRARAVHRAGARRRLSRRQPAQVAVHAARRRAPLRQEGSDPHGLAAPRRLERASRRHPQAGTSRDPAVMDDAGDRQTRSGSTR